MPRVEPVTMATLPVRSNRFMARAFYGCRVSNGCLKGGGGAVKVGSRLLPHSAHPREGGDPSERSGLQLAAGTSLKPHMGPRRSSSSGARFARPGGGDERNKI